MKVICIKCEKSEGITLGKIYEAKYYPKFETYQFIDNQGNKIGEIHGEKSNNLYYYINFITLKEYRKIIKSKKLFMINLLEIERDYRNQGWGTKFMRRMLKILRSKQIKHVILNAHPIDKYGLKITKLKKFYKSFGFRILQEDKYSCYMLLDLC